MTAPGSEAATVARDALALAGTSAPSRRPVSRRMTRRLTRRELDVLTVMAQTGLRKAAAQQLGITDQTVKNHLSAAYGKLGADHAIDAFRILGWLQVPGDRWYATELLVRAEQLIRDLSVATTEFRRAAGIDNEVAA